MLVAQESMASPLSAAHNILGGILTQELFLCSQHRRGVHRLNNLFSLCGPVDICCRTAGILQFPCSTCHLPGPRQGKRPSSVVCLRRTPHRLQPAAPATSVRSGSAADARRRGRGRRFRGFPQSTMRPWPWPRRPTICVCVRGSKSKLDGSWELLPFVACY